MRVRFWLAALSVMVTTPASAQTVPDAEARIAAYVRESSALAAADAARARADPNAALLARSRALSAVQRAEAQTLFASAFTLWQAGNYSAAEIGFRQGLEIDPANGPANFYLGDILRRRGDNGGARAYLTRAASFAPTSAEGLSAQAALRELPVSSEITEAPTVFAPQTPQVTFRDCAECPEMITIPPGAFNMGSPASVDRRSDEGPQRRISFARAFAVGRYEVTRGQYAAFTRATSRADGGNCLTKPADGTWQNSNGTWREPGFSQGEDHPVVCVSWEDAQAYVQWLNMQTRGGYRLLSEAEWEYAARAGTASIYPWGGSASYEYANYGADQWPGPYSFGMVSGRDQWVNTSPGGRFPVNAFNLHDMIGNVFEWTQDCYASSLDSVPDNGSAVESDACSVRVARGGSWSNRPWVLTSTFRYYGGPSARLYDLGFRVARRLN